MKLINSLALLSSVAVNGEVICKGAAHNYQDCLNKCKISLRCLFDIVESDDWNAPCTRNGFTFNLIDQTTNYWKETYEVTNDLDDDSVKFVFDRTTREAFGKGIDVQFRLVHMCSQL